MKRPEEALQRSVAAFLRVAAPDLLWFHPANGGARSPAEAGIFKAMGVRAGTPDLVFVLPPHGSVGFVELKAGKGRLSDSQREFAEAATAAGAAWAACRSLEEVVATLTKWGVKLRVRPA